MKIEISKKRIVSHLENISKGITAISALPALQGILIIASESNIQLITSDGNLSIKEIIQNNEQSKVSIPGKILVPGRIFKEVISKQSDNIVIESEQGLVSIISDGSKTQINLLNVNDYPVISFDTYGKELMVDANKLREIIKNVSFASAENDKRIILNGVNLKASQGKLIATATNSFRLAQEKMDINNDVDFNITILSKNLKDFIPINAKGEIKIKVEDNKIFTSYDSTTIFSKLIDGVYPEIDKLIPNEFTNILNIEVGELEKVIEKATVMSDESKRVVKLSFNKEELALESKKSEIGESVIKTKNFFYNGDQFTIVFNCQFLKDAINKFVGKISLNFIGEQKQFIVRGESNPNLVHLILPHRTF